jgi:deazaflavin-dependent oxidoreductase (nitroreductase family)
MPYLPPRWFVRSAWVAHKLLLRATSDRVGLSAPRPGKCGMLRLTTIGRRSGEPRDVVLCYRDAADPAWWHNLQARPAATVDLVTGPRPVTATRAAGAERDRLWTALHDYEGYGDLDAFSARRGRDTTVVVLSPRD